MVVSPDRRSNLIKRYLSFYQSLDHGTRAPTTAAQHHFVRVVHGETEPETEHEIAYLDFINQPEKADDRTPAPTQTEDLLAQETKSWRDYGISEFEEGSPRSELGTREDFKKDSGANWSNSRRNKL